MITASPTVQPRSPLRLAPAATGCQRHVAGPATALPMAAGPRVMRPAPPRVKGLGSGRVAEGHLGSARSGQASKGKVSSYEGSRNSGRLGRFLGTGSPDGEQWAQPVTCRSGSSAVMLQCPSSRRHVVVYRPMRGGVAPHERWLRRRPRSPRAWSLERAPRRGVAR